MLFERFEEPGLSHYSYAIGCPAAGKIAIVDPKRDIDTYLKFADQHNVTISDVLETHIHADYASGARELALKMGAELWQSAYDQGQIYQASFPHKDMHHEDHLDIGAIRIQARHTPGHTPEHLSFLIYDCNRSTSTPMLMLSGDFLFVGSVGRPDLLGEEAKIELAHKLHDSLTQLADLPDSLEVYPAHGSGSMCGAGIDGRTMSTLGYERIANPYLSQPLSIDEFVMQVLNSVPPFPEYYKRMKRLNADGPAILNGIPILPAIAPITFRKMVDEGHVVIDLRNQVSYDQGHIPNSFGIGQGESLSTWASWVVPYQVPILLVTDSDLPPLEAFRSLVRVGLDQVTGYLEGGISSWAKADLKLIQTPQTTVTELYARLQDKDPNILDVRSDAEWEEGHIEGAFHIMGGYLEKQLSSLPDGPDPIYLFCGSGYRSTVAGSILERAGVKGHVNVVGGMKAWKEAGFPITKP
ncbi:MAG TPA: MBL fold metallo-hydrolase [Rhodospirillales bacterium]|nr:MBL fold metallo-hydrolase [Rhodospirillales bacterium]